jgi:hypothetical protein
MRKVMMSAAVAVAVSGCSMSAFGPPEVKPVDVVNYYHETVRDTGELNAGEYLLASITYTNDNCHKFFDHLARVKEDSRFLDDALTAGMAAGAPLMATYNVAARTVATVTAGVAFGNSLNKSYADIYLFAEFKNELQPLVFIEMGKVLERYGLTGAAHAWSTGHELPRYLTSREAAAMIFARNIATDYASKCSLSNMRTLIAVSLNKNNGDQDDGQPGGARRGGMSILAPSAAERSE